MSRSFRPAGVVLALLAAVAIACDDEVGPAEVENFTAALTGAAERPTPVTTTATGSATLSLVGPALVYRIDVAGLSNATAAHIHLADTGTAGPVRVNLCGTGAPAPPCAGGANFTGVLASGIATQVSTITFDSLLVVLRNKGAYVNVHTSTGGCTPGTPGCNAGGEIRGQIVKP